MLNIMISLLTLNALFSYGEIKTTMINCCDNNVRKDIDNNNNNEQKRRQIISQRLSLRIKTKTNTECMKNTRDRKTNDAKERVHPTTIGLETLAS